MTPNRPIIVTAGEPAGVGPELCLALTSADIAANIVVISDADMLRDRAAMTNRKVTITEIDPSEAGVRSARDGELLVISNRFEELPECGNPSAANAPALLDGLRLAVHGCLNGQFAALVTAPLQKSTINEAGIPFTGHTEFLAELTQSPHPVMLLIAGELRVALASTHIPLRKVPDYLTPGRLRNVLQVLHDDLHTKFGLDAPEIVVCGLNPHAGERGHLGPEDDAIIAPVVQEFVNRGLRVRGPVPADTAFTHVSGRKDAVLAMYHDQGLPVLKYAGFGCAVNVTLGLPIVRTSVDHGTALDIAGTGTADAGSLIAAVNLADDLAGP